MESTVVREVTITSWHIPASVISKWPIPNTTNPERRHGLEPLTIVLLVIATGFVGARVYARVTARAGKFAADDALIMTAWIFAFGCAVSTVWGVRNAGFDRHIWDALETGRKTGLASWLQEFSFLMSTGLTKISVLVFYRRLFFTAEPRKRTWLLDVPIGVLVVYLVSVLLFIIFSCKPVNSSWDSMDANYAESYKCIDRHIFDPIKGILSVITDAYALLLPQFLIWRLKLKTESRWRLIFLFGCGWLATGAGIARTYWLTRLFTDPLRDLTWVAYEVHSCSQVEMQLAIVCASLPAAIVFTRRKSSSSDAGTSDKDGSAVSTPEAWPEAEKV